MRIRSYSSSTTTHTCNIRETGRGKLPTGSLSSVALLYTYIRTHYAQVRTCDAKPQRSPLQRSDKSICFYMKKYVLLITLFHIELTMKNVILSTVAMTVGCSWRSAMTFSGGGITYMYGSQQGNELKQQETVFLFLSSFSSLPPSRATLLPCSTALSRPR